MPLPRPHDQQAQHTPPQAPLSLGALGEVPWLLRIAQRLSIPLSKIDDMTIEEVLDERDLLLYLHDVDCPPAPPPKPDERALRSARIALSG